MEDHMSVFREAVLKASEDVVARSSAEFTGAILMCPVCSTAVDAERWGANQCTCLNCGTMFAVILDPEVVARYSII